MVFLVITTIIVIAIFVVTILNLIRKNDTNFLYLLIVEFIGILIDFIHVFSGKDISPLGYGVVYLLSVVIPLIIIYIDYKGFCFDEIIGLVKIKINPENERQILLDLAGKYPNHYKIHKLLAEYYEDHNETEKAEDEYYKVISIKEDDYKSYCKLGEILEKNRKTDEAIDLLQNLLKMEPGHSEGSMLLGQIYYDHEMFKEALSIFNEALHYNPGEYYLYYYLGMVYTRLNDFQNAYENYGKAAKLNSIKDVAKLNQGQISMIFKEYDEAEKYFFELLDSEDEKIVANSYYYLAKINMIRGKEQAAIQYANLAIEIYPKVARKIEKDEILIAILGKLKIMKDKQVESKITKKQEEIIDYLDRTNDVVENLTDRSGFNNVVKKEREER